MNWATLETWAAENPEMALGALLILSAAAFLFARNVIGRVLFYMAARTASKSDDMLVRHLRPFRTAWLAPLLVVYAFAPFFPSLQTGMQKTTLILIVWLSAVTFNALLNAVNDIYENSKNYNGVSIQGYLDLVKILAVVVAIIFSITLLTGQSPWVLLTSLGALTAVVLLIFQGTLLSLVASIQIVANDLIKEGDWIEVPSYSADGDVVNINLHTIKIRNFDMTYSVIPTYKIVEVAYRNWRGMKESGGRRIQRSISVDMNTIKFCDAELLQRLRRIDRLQSFVDRKIEDLEAYRQEHADHFDSPLDGPQTTNVEIFRRYIVKYLKSREDIYQENMPFLVRALAPSPNGLDIEVYVFAKTTEWTAYELIQSEIFDHLLAAAPNFDLRVFQQPSGLDFSDFSRSVRSA